MQGRFELQERVQKWIIPLPVEIQKINKNREELRFRDFQGKLTYEQRLIEKITDKMKFEAKKKHEPISKSPESEKGPLAPKVVYHQKQKFNSISVKEKRT